MCLWFKDGIASRLNIPALTFTCLVERMRGIANSLWERDANKWISVIASIPRSFIRIDREDFGSTRSKILAIELTTKNPALRPGFPSGAE